MLFLSEKKTWADRIGFPRPAAVAVAFAVAFAVAVAVAVAYLTLHYITLLVSRLW